MKLRKNLNLIKMKQFDKNETEEGHKFDKNKTEEELKFDKNLKF